MNASYTVKREGENIADAFYGQDDSGQPAASEVFRFDFDGRRPNTNVFGGPTLGNDKETTLGGGDSGGPSFVLEGGAYKLAGVNTFTQGNAPRFGSLGGGTNLFPYTAWIQGIAGASSGSSESTAEAAAEKSLGLAGSLVLVVPPDVVIVASISVPSASESASSSQISTGESDLLSTSDGEPSAALASEIVIVVASSSDSSSSTGEASSDDDGFLNALDAVLEDWLPIIDG